MSSLMSILGWLPKVQEYVNKGKDLVKGKLGVVGDIAGIVIDTGQKLAGEAVTNFGDNMKKVQKIVEGAQVILNGVLYVVMEIGGAVLKYWKSGRKGIALGATLIAGSGCSPSTFRESTQVMEKAAEALFWMRAASFSYENHVPCTALRTAYHDAEHFLKSCVQSRDAIYKDTGILVGQTVEVIDQFCNDRRMQTQFDSCGCRCDCTSKNERMLDNFGLVSHNVGPLGEIPLIGKWPDSKRSAKHPSLQQICSATRTVSSCETGCHEKTLKLDDVLARNVGNFCTRHAAWDGVFKPAQEPATTAAPVDTGNATTAAPKETTTTAGATSLKEAFFYLSLIVSMVI